MALPVYVFVSRPLILPSLISIPFISQFIWRGSVVSSLQIFPGTRVAVTAWTPAKVAKLFVKVILLVFLANSCSSPS